MHHYIQYNSSPFDQQDKMETVEKNTQKGKDKVIMGPNKVYEYLHNYGGQLVTIISSDKQAY